MLEYVKVYLKMYGCNDDIHRTLLEQHKILGVASSELLKSHLSRTQLPATNNANYCIYGAKINKYFKN